MYSKSSRLPVTICGTFCTGKESQLSQCKLKSCDENYLFQLPCKKENAVGVVCSKLTHLLQLSYIASYVYYLGIMYVPTSFIANLTAPGEDGDDHSEVGSGNDGQINEHGHPIDDEDSNGDDQDIDSHDQDANNHVQDDNKIDGDVSVGDVGITDDGNDENSNVGFDETAGQTQSEENQDGSKQSDDSVSAGIIVTIVLSCLFIFTVILVVLGFVCLSYKRRRPTFIVTQDYPKILVASDTQSKTTSIPRTYMQSPRFSPKGYEALPVTDYVPVQPYISKPVY